MHRGKTVGVVVPAYNEELLIERVIETMPDYIDHIVVVDDASSDAAGLALVFSFGKGLMNHLFSRALGVPLTLTEGFGLVAVTPLANHLPSSGGLIAKGAYLKQRHQLGYTRLLSATPTSYVCSLALNGMLGLGVIAYWSLASITAVPPALIFSFSAMATSSLLLVLVLQAVDPVEQEGH